MLEWDIERHPGCKLEYPAASSIRDMCCVVIDGVSCNRIVYNKSLQLCNAHNLQRLRGQEFRSVRIRRGVNEYMSSDCTEPGCTHPAQARGLCTSHYWQMMNKGQTDTLYKTRRPKGSVLERDEFGRKFCSSCREWLPEEDFGVSSRTLDSLRRECRLCRSTTTRIKNGEKSLPEKREWLLRRRYGKTPQWFQETFEAQGEMCACCQSSNPGGRGWQIDHDHTCCDIAPGGQICGECIRGIICNSCNLALGLVKDSIETLQRMQEYLRGKNE